MQYGIFPNEINTHGDVSVNQFITRTCLHLDTSKNPDL